MKRLSRIILILILTAAMMLSCCGSIFAAQDGLPVSSHGNASDSVRYEIEQILARRMEKAGVSSLQELVWYFADNAGNGEEWYIVSMRQQYPGTLDFSEYRKAYETYAESSDIKSASTRLKTALTLQAIGSKSSYIDKTADDAIGQLGIMSYIYGLHVLTNGAKSSFTVDSVIDTLLSLQLADGGWAVMGDGGDVDVTAMTIQALAPYYDSSGIIKTSLDHAVERLASLQRDDGTFISFGAANAESTAQVLMALSSLGIDCTKDERFIKDGRTVLDVLDTFRISDGVYSHELENKSENASAAIQTLYSLVSYDMMLSGKGQYYAFGELSEPSVPRPADPDKGKDPADPDGGKTDPVDPAPAKNSKPLLYGIIAAAAVTACVVLALLKKRSYKSYLFVMILAAVAVCAVRFINIQRPDNYYDNTEDLSDPIRTTISIRCDTIAGEKDYIPKDGIILDKYEIIIDKGQSAYDQLIAAVKANRLHIDGNSGYISGIENIYEMDFGDLSGWMFRVNGIFSDVGCGEKILAEGDFVEWMYTKDLGKDIGNEYKGGN